MRYLEAPNYLQINEYKRSIFLAGTITGSEDWQTKVAERLLDETSLQIFNPRRKNFNAKDDLDKEQIEWEWVHLEAASTILFWFTKDTVAPITLFELGKFIRKDIVVGCDLEYPRRKDLEIQLHLERPKLRIRYSLTDLIKTVVQKESGYALY